MCACDVKMSADMERDARVKNAQRLVEVLRSMTEDPGYQMALRNMMPDTGAGQRCAPRIAALTALVVQLESAHPQDARRAVELAAARAELKEVRTELKSLVLNDSSCAEAAAALRSLNVKRAAIAPIYASDAGSMFMDALLYVDACYERWTKASVGVCPDDDGMLVVWPIPRPAAKWLFTARGKAKTNACDHLVVFLRLHGEDLLARMAVTTVLSSASDVDYVRVVPTMTRDDVVDVLRAHIDQVIAKLP